jgi:nitroreductase
MTIAPHTLPPPPVENDFLPEPRPDAAFLARLALRRSTKVAHLTSPGPEGETLDAILRLGARVPDHGKLGPWRFIILSGDNRHAYGRKIAGLLSDRGQVTDPERLAQEEGRFLRAPLVLAVVFSPVESPKVPEWEQALSAGAVCYNLLLAANGFGFGGCWLSEWVAYDRDALALLGLCAHEKLAGLIYLGTPSEAPIERPRPTAASRITHWQPK